MRLLQKSLVWTGCAKSAATFGTMDAFDEVLRPDLARATRQAVAAFPDGNGLRARIAGGQENRY